MKQIIIIGASGHGKVVADIATLNGYDTILFLDDDESRTECGSYPVVGTSRKLDEMDGDVIVAIGNAVIREKIQQQVEQKKRVLATLVHPRAVVCDDVVLGAGTVVMAGAVINAGSCIGKGCIINTSSSVDHDCHISDFAHIAVGAHLAGTVSIGKRTWIGIGAVVRNNIHITDDCMIGAGAAVVKDIYCTGTYMGVPAKPF